MSRKKIQISELDLNKIGCRIAYIRLFNNEGQDVFAVKSGLSKSNVSGLENHKYEPSFKAMVKISETYSINANWLLFGKGDIFLDNDSVSNSDVTTYEHPVDTKHMELIKQFKNKELAFAVSEKLIRLESISRGLFLKAESDIERLIDTAEIIVGEQTTNQKGRMVGKEEKKKA